MSISYFTCFPFSTFYQMILIFLRCLYLPHHQTWRLYLLTLLYEIVTHWNVVYFLVVYLGVNLVVDERVIIVQTPNKDDGFLLILWFPDKLEQIDVCYVLYLLWVLWNANFIFLYLIILMWILILVLEKFEHKFEIWSFIFFRLEADISTKLLNNFLRND